MSLEPDAIVAHEYGDSGVLFDFIDNDYDRRWAQSQSIGSALRQSPPAGFQDLVASYQNLFVSFDPRLTSHSAITAAVRELATHLAPPQPSRLFQIGVVYGDNAGPDVQAIADVCGMTAAQVIEAHAATQWVIRFVASPIGAPLMDGSQLPVSVPRLATPRAKVEPGSVAVSGKQCVIYNAPSPGGWQILGRTPSLMFDLANPPHVLYRAGDRLQCIPISPAEWDTWAVPPRLVAP